MISTGRPRGFGSDSPTGSSRARGSPQFNSYSLIFILSFGYKFLISLCIRFLTIIGCFSISTKLYFFFSITLLVVYGSKLTLKGKYSL